MSPFRFLNEGRICSAPRENEGMGAEKLACSPSSCRRRRSRDCLAAAALPSFYRPVCGIVPTMSTVPATSAKTSELALFGRLLRARKGKMSPSLARYVLGLRFPAEDQARMEELAAGNQDGNLSPDEQEELQSYVKAGHLLALLHAQARQALKQRKGR
jgi:hypothetical protein